MTCQLVAVSLDANDPAGLARFWAGVLGWDVAAEPRHGVALVPSDDTGFQLRFLPTDEPKVSKNHMHFDLTSTSLENQQQTMAKAIELGARHIDVGQRPEERHFVLGDPEGNEFCVIEPGNQFLANCGFVGAVACDGSQEVGYFWGKALGWPLVWDQNQETAIRSPRGGPKITWGGELPEPHSEKNRLRFEVAAIDSDQQTEVDRLRSLGATRIDGGDAQVGSVPMTDPDGREFRLL